MIWININVKNWKPGSTLYIGVEGETFPASSGSLDRMTFQLPDRMSSKVATLVFGMRAKQFTLPVPGAWEGTSVGLSDLIEFPSYFSELFPLRGVSDFRFLQLSMLGQDISPMVDQRMDAGARIFRTFGMKANNTGWELNPAGRPDYPGDLRKFFDLMGNKGARVYFTLFADTISLMPFQDEMLKFRDMVMPVIAEYQTDFAVIPEFANEATHPTQAPILHSLVQLLTPPADITWWSRGSRLTDEDPVRPYGPMAGYSARRDGPPDARGLTNYDPDEFQAVYPQPTRKFAQEGIKPQGYRFDTEWAHKMGQKARENGGFFHTDEGVNGLMWDTRVFACAEAFYQGMLLI